MIYSISVPNDSLLTFKAAYFAAPVSGFAVHWFLIIPMLFARSIQTVGRKIFTDLLENVFYLEITVDRTNLDFSTNPVATDL